MWVNKVKLCQRLLGSSIHTPRRMIFHHTKYRITSSKTRNRTINSNMEHKHQRLGGNNSSCLCGHTVYKRSNAYKCNPEYLNITCNLYVSIMKLCHKGRKVYMSQQWTNFMFKASCFIFEAMKGEFPHCTALSTFQLNKGLAVHLPLGVQCNSMHSRTMPLINSIK